LGTDYPKWRIDDCKGDYGAPSIINFHCEAAAGYWILL